MTRPLGPNPETVAHVTVTVPEQRYGDGMHERHELPPDEPDEASEPLGTTGATHEGDPTLTDLQGSADEIIERARAQAPYQDGDTISCVDTGAEEQGVPPSDMWMTIDGGYAVLHVQSRDEHGATGDIGSFPLSGVPGRPQHLRVRNAVGSPVAGDPVDWLADKLGRMRIAMDEHPELCRVGPS